MPNLLPSDEKTAFIALVNAAPYPGGPSEAARLEDILIYCEDVPMAITRQINLFAGNNAYLTEALGVFSENTLEFAGIQFGVTETETPVQDPLIIANSTISNVVLNPNTSSPPTEKGIVIIGTSTIATVTLNAGTVVDNFFIGGPATVDQLDASSGVASPPSSPPAYTAVNNLWLSSLRSQTASLNRVTYGSMINQVIKDQDSYFGGVLGYDPELPCSIPVTNMRASEVTSNGILVSWTAPLSGYLFINTYYRLHSSSDWIKATTEDGDFTGNVGFIFRHLQKDTFYDFKAEVECNNGGRISTELTVQTVCCGAGSRLPQYITCPLTVNITAEENSPPYGLELCNGAKIALNYPPGTTLTIPLLASLNAVPGDIFTVGTTPYQDVPFDSERGRWDVSTTALGTLEEGNIVSTEVTFRV